MHQEKRTWGKTRFVYDAKSGEKELLVLSICPSELMMWDLILSSCNRILDSGRHLRNKTFAKTWDSLGILRSYEFGLVVVHSSYEGIRRWMS